MRSRSLYRGIGRHENRGRPIRYRRSRDS